jgi:hypothetical protein
MTIKQIIILAIVIIGGYWLATNLTNLISVGQMVYQDHQFVAQLQAELQKQAQQRSQVQVNQVEK